MITFLKTMSMPQATGSHAFIQVAEHEQQAVSQDLLMPCCPCGNVKASKHFKSAQQHLQRSHAAMFDQARC